MTQHLFELAKLSRRNRKRNQALIRAACSNAYLGDHTSLARVLGRYKMYLDTRDVAFAPHMLTEGYWEMWHTEAMAKLLKRGMTAVDLGANLGYFTLLMSDIVGPKGTVHAFEPNPHIAGHLRNSVEINGFGARTTVHQLALSDHEGDFRFFIDPSRPMNATLVPREEHEVVQVATTRFDDIPQVADADFIKIDVEGAEEAVFAGMAKRLANPKPLTIILEFTAARYHDAGAFVDALTAAGFSLASIDPHAGIVRADKSAILAQPPAEDQLLVLRR